MKRLSLEYSCTNQPKEILIYERQCSHHHNVIVCLTIISYISKRAQSAGLIATAVYVTTLSIQLTFKIRKSLAFNCLLITTVLGKTIFLNQSFFKHCAISLGIIINLHLFEESIK